MLSTSRLAESQEDYTKVFNNVRKTTRTLASFMLRKLKELDIILSQPNSNFENKYVKPYTNAPPN